MTLRETVNYSLTESALSPYPAEPAHGVVTAEIAGMRGNKVEETSFLFGVAERTERDGVYAGNVHNAKILNFEASRGYHMRPSRECGF
jgi:hypothetical protein